MRKASFNKEKLVFLLAFAVLVIGIFTYVQHRTAQLSENDPLPKVGPPSLQINAPPTESRGPVDPTRASPFMPPKTIVIPATPPHPVTSVPLPEPPPQLPPKVEHRPKPAVLPPSFSFMGIVMNEARACALVRKPDGTPLRVYKGDTLPDSDLKVKDIQKQSIELVDLNGHCFELTSVGLR